MADDDQKEPTKLTALNLLENFEAALRDENDPVSFIGTIDPDDWESSSVAIPLGALIRSFTKAEKDKKEKEEQDRNAAKKAKRDKEAKAGEGSDAPKRNRTSLADFLDWHDVHKHGQDLWKELMRSAISDIDPGAKGHSQLLKYLEAATEFEDLLYGLEEFYRDHTLHSLWVYLIGVTLMRGEQLSDMAGDLNWYLFNGVKEGECPEELEQWASLERDYLNCEIQKKRDAIWCIIALCHDLGYSLAKLPKLNEKVQAVLKFYAVSDFRHVGYALDLEHQYLVKQFLELMAMDVWVTPSSDYLECRKNEQDSLKELLRRIEDVRKKWEKAEEKAKKEAKREEHEAGYLRTLLLPSSAKKTAKPPGATPIAEESRASPETCTTMF